MASPLLSEAARLLPPSVFAGLQDRLASYQGEVFPLHIGDTHLAPPIAADCFDLDDPALYRYGKIAGWDELVAAIQQNLRARPGLSAVATEQIQLSAGATHAICSAARAILNAGDEVIVPTPYWPLATGMVQACGARPIEVPLSGALYANPRADVRELLEPHVGPRTRAIYLITPNNPDGKVFTRPQLEGIAEIARARDLWVISDEVYQDYVYDGEHVPLASLPGMAERTLTAFSFSKSHGMAGLRIGYLVGPPGAIAAVRALHFHTIYSVPLLVQRMALSALREGAPWLAGARAAYVGARDAVAAQLAGSGLGYHVPEGGSYFFVDFAPVLRGRPLLELLRGAVDRGVLLAPGVAFGKAHETSARICFTGLPTAKVVEGVSRVVELARELGR